MEGKPSESTVREDWLNCPSPFKRQLITMAISTLYELPI